MNLMMAATKTSPTFAPPSSSRTAVATGAVVVTQLSFMSTAYVHAYLEGTLAHDKFHISAVLDHDDRSSACACVGVISLVSLVILELCRALPMRGLRAFLAVVTGVGIILTCVVRESVYVNAHRGIAALAFGAAVALVWLVSSLAKNAVGLRAAHALVCLIVVTGFAQFCNILSQINDGTQILPSWALGSLEIGLCAHAAHRTSARKAHSVFALPLTPRSSPVPDAPCAGYSASRAAWSRAALGEGAAPSSRRRATTRR